LLIVLAILAALAIVVIPVGMRANAIGRRAYCAANLRHVSELYAMFMTDHRDDPSALAGDTWVTTLLAYLLDRPHVFICPEDIEPDWAWPSVTMRTTWLGGRDEAIFELYPYWLDGDHDDFDPKPKIWKVNTEVYEAMGSSRQDMPKYTPGSNPDEYWFILEDIGDDDFYDFDLHVKEVSKGIVEITGVHWPNAHASHYIVDPDGVAHHVIDEVGPLRFSVPPTSYGISSKAYRLVPGSRKIAFLDYESRLCRVLDDVGPDAGWSDLKAPRHLGEVNVLFASGEVEWMDPAEIDPETVTPASETLWAPDLDRSP